MPLSNYVGHAHWSRVCWVPFRDCGIHDFWLDALANVALYAPFGFLAARSQVRKGITAILVVAGLAALLSVSGELFEIFCHNRFPSMTDVSTNTLGAALGALINRIHPISGPQT